MSRIIRLQGYASMVNAFKESHEKDIERLAADRRREGMYNDLHGTRPMFQKVVEHVANTQVRSECTVMHRVYIVV